MTSPEVIRIYSQNQAAIDPIWTARECTMGEAVRIWQENATKGRKEIYAEAESLFQQYRDLGMSKREAKKQVRKDLEQRYAGDDRLLTILYWILRFSMLFIFIL
jgi:hypothetical protein